jgi:hypothetical protein
MQDPSATFLILDLTMMTLGGAEFDTRAIHASPDSPGVELGATPGLGLALFCAPLRAVLLGFLAGQASLMY